MIHTSFIIPVLVLLLGFWMYKYPPNKINLFVGYRTNKSMKNKEMWDFAQKYCGKLWVILGLIMIVLTSLLYLLVWLKVIIFTENILLIVELVEVSVLLISIPLVENRLKKYNGE